MSEKTEIQKKKYTQGNFDARDGFPMNRFLRTDPDYVEGYRDMEALISRLSPPATCHPSSPEADPEVVAKDEAGHS